MRHDLDPREVSARLAELRCRYVPETIDAARPRHEQVPPRPIEPFERGVARSLAELRALCELTRYLHRKP